MNERESLIAGARLLQVSTQNVLLLLLGARHLPDSGRVGEEGGWEGRLYCIPVAKKSEGCVYS